MNELKEKAYNYAEENVINVLKEAFAKVYSDGYRDGYKNREDEIPVDLRDNKTEFVDLGLPSGTLWAAHYEEENGNVRFLPYSVACEMNIPTEEQWNELVANCKRVFEIEYGHKPHPRLLSVSFVGRNGNFIKLPCCGMLKADSVDWNNFVCFWINENRGGDYKKLVRFSDSVGENGPIETKTEYEGFHLPVRLVRKQ